MSTLELFIMTLMAVSPRSKIMKDADYRAEVVSIINEASTAFALDKFDLASVFYFESSFDYTAESKSKLKEYGLGQVHGKAKRACSAAGYTLNNVQNQIYCTAYLLSKLRSDCKGSMTRAFYKYMSGNCRGTPRAKRMLKYRRNKAKRTLERIKK